MFRPEFSIFSKFLDTERQGFRTFSLACFAKIFGTFSCFQKGTPVGTNTDTKNVPECTGNNVPVFPVHFHENVPKFESVSERHGSSRDSSSLIQNLNDRGFNKKGGVSAYTWYGLKSIRQNGDYETACCCQKTPFNLNVSRLYKKFSFHLLCLKKFLIHISASISQKSRRLKNFRSSTISIET